MEPLHMPPARVISPPPAIVDGATPITAGRYLQLRREANRFSVEQAVGHTGLIADQKLLTRWRAAEANDAILDDDMLALIAKAFPFDPFIYQCLRDGIPAGRICTGCGCSWNDACQSADGRTCAWVSERPELCSACLLGESVRAPRHLIAADATFSAAVLDALRPFAAVAQSIATACPDDREMEFRFRARHFRAAARALADAGVR